MLKRYYYAVIGEKVLMLRAKTDSGAVKQAEKLGEGVQVWFDHPEESWSARLVHVTKSKAA